MTLKDKEMMNAFRTMLNDKYNGYAETRQEMLWDIYEIAMDEEELLREGKYEEFKNLCMDIGYLDKITGEITGSYFCNRWQAKERIWEQINLVQEILGEWYGKEIPLELAYDWEKLDCMVRNYLLESVLDEFCRLYETEIKPLENK